MPKLLVVTSDSYIHDSICRMIASPGMEVPAAWNAHDGWRQIRCDSPDAVVIDLDLPGGSGLDLFERIRATDPRLPIVFVTTEGTADLAIEAMTRGAFDYLLRPLDPKQVNPGLAGAFQASRLMRTPVILPHDLVDGGADYTGVQDQVLSRPHRHTERQKSLFLDQHRKCRMPFS